MSNIEVIEDTPTEKPNVPESKIGGDTYLSKLQKTVLDNNKKLQSKIDQVDANKEQLNSSERELLATYRDAYADLLKYSGAKDALLSAALEEIQKYKSSKRT